MQSWITGYLGWKGVFCVFGFLLKKVGLIVIHIMIRAIFYDVNKGKNEKLSFKKNSKVNIDPLVSFSTLG